MNALGSRVPHLSIGFDERLDLARREIDSLVTQCHQRFARLADETMPQLFVGADLTDEQLNRFLRHRIDSLSPGRGNDRAIGLQPPVFEAMPV